MSGLNPQGCTVHSFKAPSEEELDHDFLWRAALRYGLVNPSEAVELTLTR